MTDRIAVRVTGEDEGVSTLLRTLSKQLGEVQKGQAKANAEANAGAKAQQAQVSTISKLVSHLRQLVSVYSAIRVARFVKDQLDAADALSKLSQKSGISTETLSKLAFAGETADVSIEQLGTSAKLFAKSIADLQRGGTGAADAFKSIGLGARDLKNLTPDEAFLKTLKTLGSYQDGLEKAEVAQQIFGKSGSELIPLANQIAEEGFGSIEEAAAKAGRVISTEAGKAAEDFNDQLRSLKGQAQGAALAFGQEVVPAISDVLTALSNMGDEGEQSVAKTFGQQAAKTIRETAIEAIALTKGIGAELKDLGTIGVETWAAIKKAASGDFAQASEHIANASSAFQHLQTAGAKAFQETRDAFDKAEKDRDAKTSAERKKREDAEKKRIILADTKAAAEIAKARQTAEEHAREGEGKILAASLALRDQEVERAFSKGLSALSDYFQARRQTIVEAGAQEVAALKATRDAIAKQPVATPVERIQRNDQVAQKNVEIKVAESKITEQLNALDFQRADLAETLAQTVGEAEAKIREARGESSAAAKASLDKDVEAYRVALAKLGTLTKAQQEKLATDFRVTLTLDIDAKDTQQKVDQLFGDIDRERTRLDQKVRLGQLSQQQADKQLIVFEQARVPVLTQLADEATRLATNLGNPELIARAQDLTVQIEGLGKAASRSAQLAANVPTDALDALEGNLSTFLGSTVSQVNSVGDAFKSLASDVVGSIQRIIAQLLAAKAVESIARLLGLGIAGGLPLVDAAGGSAVAGFGFARGGYTGPGGKYQPAGIVHKGEYVFPQQAVRRIGISRLDALADLRTPSIARPRRGYADGGLVTTSNGGGELTGTLVVEVDEGVIVRNVAAHLKSPMGQRQIVDVAVKQRGRLRGILG